jgi:hypothetical protein
MRRVICLIFLLVIIMQAAGCVGPIRGECYLGAKGTAASVTVKGRLAGQACSDILTKQRWNIAQIEFYEMSRPPTEPVLCEYDISSGHHIIIRDRGLIPATGLMLCEFFKSQ